MMNVLLCFFLFIFSCSLEATQASEFQFQTINLSARLSSTSVCNRASKNDLKNRASSRTVLEVVHKHGPCAALTNNMPINISLADILVQDQLRVQSIQALVADTNKPRLDNKKSLGLKDKKPTLPARYGESLGTGNYIVTIGLGTPVRNLTLSFDTGGYVMWTQCLPCLGQCYQQKEPIFDPCASTTYSKIQCNSTECSELNKYEGALDCYLNSTCVYGSLFGDGSYTFGFYSRDTLTVTPAPTDVFPNFQFGCGHNNTGLFGQTAGLLGLGRGPDSFVSQTKKKYLGLFSYCLPLDMSSTGFLTFGGKCNNNNRGAKMEITPLIPSPQSYPESTFYYIEITAISVGGTRLKINESIFKTAGAIIDSGTTFTYLPPAAYKALSTEFKKQMTSKLFKYKIAPPSGSFLDTCFHITTNTVNIPSISFTFKGDATLTVDPNGTLWIINSTLQCLSFKGNRNPADIAIFGNIQQVNYEVMYDVPGNQLRFLKNPGCL